MIPQYETFMLPLLQFLGDGKEHSTSECAGAMASFFNLTEEEKETTDDRNIPVYRSRMGWAKTYMKNAGLVENNKKGIYLITGEGRKVLVEHPSKIDRNYLLKYPSFREFQKRSGNKTFKQHIEEESDGKTPLESMTAAYKELSSQLASDLLDKVLSESPEFFERLVVDLLRKMGYGISSKVTRFSGDGGIDGIIEEDKLGLDNIYIQAKRWAKDNKVSRPQLQAFIGAMADRGGSKGVFITTSSFTQDAQNYHPNNYKIALIDGTRLASLMIEYSLGVSVSQTFAIKKIDNDYFEEQDI